MYQGCACQYFQSILSFGGCPMDCGSGEGVCNSYLPSFLLFASLAQLIQQHGGPCYWSWSLGGLVYAEMESDNMPRNGHWPVQEQRWQLIDNALLLT